MSNKDVHTEHCCAEHGCKYGDIEDCTVANGRKKQSFPCETCRECEEATKRVRYHIWSNEHKGWWAPNSRGYVVNRTQAGIYTYEQTLAIVKGANYAHSKKPGYSLPDEIAVPVGSIGVAYDDYEKYAETTITIPQSKFEELEDDAAKFNCLVEQGVDNWPGYDDAMSEFHESKAKSR